MTKRTILLISLILAILFPQSAMAEPATILTVGLIRKTLLDSISQLNSALKDATAGVKAVGNSLEANARGVVSDIDARLGNKLDYTFDRLDQSERRFMEDSQILIDQLRNAAKEVVNLTENAARRVLGDADIVAYNALYSLPCRNQVPRIVYTTPDEYYEGYSVPEVSIRGNFLDLGREPTITVNGVQAGLLARSSNLIRVSLPAAVRGNIAHAHSVSIRFRPTARYRRCLVGIIPWSSEKTLDNDLSASVLLQPETVAKIEATMIPIINRRETGSWVFGDNRGTDGDCDRHFDSTLTFCIPDAWGGRLIAEAAHSQPDIHSKNCRSDIEGIDIVGDRCIRVRSHIGGCDYVNYGFVKDCKGNGWLNYHITLFGERFVPVEGSPFASAIQMRVPVQTNFIFKYLGELNGESPTAWRYRAVVNFYRGDNSSPIRTIEVSDSDSTVGGVSSRFDNALLSIDIEQAVSSLFQAK